MEKTVWSREALIADLPKLCLGCRGHVRFAPRTLVKDEPGYCSTLVDYPTAVCSDDYKRCGKVYAPQPADGTRYGAGYKFGRGEVTFVVGPPYHVPLSKLGARLFEAKPGRELLLRGVAHIGVAQF